MNSRPSILTMLQTAGTIESLAEMREMMLNEIAAGQLSPSNKTFRAWQEAIWVRVLELMALRPREVPYIVNVIFTWPKPDALRELLEEQMKLCVETLAAPFDEAQGKTAEPVLEVVL